MLRERGSKALRAIRLFFRGGLGDDQSSRSTLGVVLCLQGRGHVIMRLRTHAGEWRHDDPVRKIEVSHPIWCEKWLIRHHMSSLDGCGAYRSCFVLECSHLALSRLDSTI